MHELVAERIRASLGVESLANLDELEVFPELESTNSYLLQQPSPAVGRFRAAMAEHQTAGRGRFDKRWVSPPGSGLCLSLSYACQRHRHDLPRLPLAVGVGLADSLEHIGAQNIELKWPNDIMSSNAKLGGILVEVLPSESEIPAVVIGIGLNLDLSICTVDELSKLSASEVTDLVSVCRDLPDRSMLAAIVIDSVFKTAVRFESEGFSRFYAAWQHRDWLHGRPVTVAASVGIVNGVSAGIDSDGALLVDAAMGRQRIVSGSVTRSGQPVYANE